VKAYAAVTAKRTAIEERRRAELEEMLRTVLEYKEQATIELMRRKRERRSRPEIIPHPDDIDVDPKTGAVVLNGPVTPDQKMAKGPSCVEVARGRTRVAKLAALRCEGSLVFASAREAQKTGRNCRSLGGEAGVEDQFMGLGDAGGANRSSAKVPLANDKQELSSGVRPIRILFQIDFPPLARDRADRRGATGVSDGSAQGLP
jgi:hypothetical protein